MEKIVHAVHTAGLTDTGALTATVRPLQSENSRLSCDAAPDTVVCSDLPAGHAAGKGRLRTPSRQRPSEVTARVQDRALGLG